MNRIRFAPAMRASLTVLGLCLVWEPSASGQTIVRVEEDWELVVATPDQNSTAPQVTCTISPVGHTNAVHATFELNHQSQPDFSAGGLQLLTWLDETPQSFHKSRDGEAMSQLGETVTWTQTMTLGENTVTFAVAQGNSATWGAFGGDQLQSTANVSLADLNGYSPDVSVQNSGVGFAANRVQSLILRRVRLVTSTGDVVADNVPRVVHSQN